MMDRSNLPYVFASGWFTRGLAETLGLSMTAGYVAVAIVGAIWIWRTAEPKTAATMPRRERPNRPPPPPPKRD